MEDSMYWEEYSLGMDFYKNSEGRTVAEVARESLGSYMVRLGNSWEKESFKNLNAAKKYVESKFNAGV